MCLQTDQLHKCGPPPPPKGGRPRFELGFERETNRNARDAAHKTSKSKRTIIVKNRSPHDMRNNIEGQTGATVGVSFIRGPPPKRTQTQTINAGCPFGFPFGTTKPDNRRTRTAGNVSFRCQVQAQVRRCLKQRKRQVLEVQEKLQQRRSQRQKKTRKQHIQDGS